MPAKSPLAEPIEQRTKRERMELPALPEEVVSQLHERLGVPANFDNRIDMELRLIAWLYEDQAPQGDKTDRMARRGRMRAMAKGLASTLTAHETLDAADLRRIVTASPDAGFQELAQAKLPKGLEASDRLASYCRRLIDLYEQVTGKRATHTSLEKGWDETKKPQSEAGRFVWTFFAWLDPQALGRLNETLRKIIWPSRAEKRTRV